MTDLTRTLKMIADCDDEVHFERQVKRELLRLHDLIVKADALAHTQAALNSAYDAARRQYKRQKKAAQKSAMMTTMIGFYLDYKEANPL